MKENVIREKSFQFALEIVKLYQQLVGQKEYVISKQLLRSGTSIGANVEEAGAAQSKKDFVSKMSIASKEARESKYWLRLLQKSDLTAIEVNTYINNVESIINILTKIIKTTSERIGNAKIKN